MQNAVIGIAHTEVDTQFRRGTDRIVCPPVEGVLVVIALQVAEHDYGAAGITRVSRKKVGHRTEVSAERRVRRPRSTCAIENETVALIDLVEDVQAGAAVFTAGLQLMTP